MNLVEQSLQIPAGGVALDADLAVPEPKRGVVLFAHGSGSSSTAHAIATWPANCKPPAWPPSWRTTRPCWHSPADPSHAPYPNLSAFQGGHS